MNAVRACLSLVVACLLLSPLEVAAAEQTSTRTEDVIYGRKFGTALTMDVFTPAKPNGLGVILVVSGGWYSAHEAINPIFFQNVLDRGYTVFAVVHGSQPKFTIPEILSDMHRAVRFIRHHAKGYGIDPDRIGIMGGSAGGHLSLMQWTAGAPGNPDAADPVERESSRVQAVACFFPPTDFLNYGKEGEIALGRGVLKDFPAPFDFEEMSQEKKDFVKITDEEKIQEIGKQISPINHVSSDDPPTLIVHGDADTLVPIQQAEIIVDKLEEAGVKAELITKPGAGHGWGDFPADIAKFADWFDKHLRPGKNGEATTDEKTAASRFEVPATDEGIPGAGPIRRHDWFKTLWRERREKFAKENDKDKGAVVFFGDSITQGWSDDFRGKFPGLKAANRGISGDTTRGMLYRLEEDVLAVKPKAVVMLMGTNDRDEEASPETIADNIKLILERLRENDEEMPIALCLVMPSSPSKNRRPGKIKELNRLLTEAAKDFKQVTVVDTWSIFANDEGNAKEEEFPDLLHPNDAGYEKWAKALRPALKNAKLLNE
jgi:acetyl esterase/lipase/lysophospholipase L1-like esterase